MIRFIAGWVITAAAWFGFGFMVITLIMTA